MESQVPMSSPIAERLRDAVSQAHWSVAVALLQTSDKLQAAEALGDLPFEQQQSLFRHLPLDLAAAVVAQFPYYHEYVLLHSLPAGEMRALVDEMNPNDRMRSFHSRGKQSSKGVRLRSVLSNRTEGKFRSSLRWTYPSSPASSLPCLGLQDPGNRPC